MYSAEPMPKGQTFKLRLDDEDRARLEQVAKHYSLPIASLVRMLVKREADALEAKSEKPKRAPKRTRR